MIGFIVIVAIFAVAAFAYWLTTLKPNDEATDLLHEYGCMKLYLFERRDRGEGLFLCRIAREEMFSEEFKRDLEKRLIRIKETDLDLFIPSHLLEEISEPVSETPFERVQYGDQFWDWDDYARRLDFLDRIINRIEGNG